NDIGSNAVILSDGNDVVIADDISNAEKTFYAKVDDYKNGLSSSMREKTMITVSYYNKILNALKQTTSGKETGVNSYFYAWCKKFFRVDNSAGVDLLYSSKNGTRLVVLEAYYTILRDVHEKTGHGGRDKMRVEVKQHYYWIPSKVISIYLSTCIACQIRKPVKNHVVSTAIVSLGFLTRLQIALIDLRTRPDGEFKWILHARDHFSKFSWGYALQTKEAKNVAEHLTSLFYQFGPCKILQSDNGKEFTAQ
ncbi:unnamed protein product, partial [Didymodactylos carnosus]